jgi:hypothetical protein
VDVELPELAAALIQLSRASKEEEARILEAHRAPIAGKISLSFSDLFSPATLEAFQEAQNSPARRALIGFLEELPEEDLGRLRSLMYYGRNREDGDFEIFHQELLKEFPQDKAGFIQTMLGKAPLAEYLREGLSRLNLLH